jgi:hypothetical protein
MFTESRLRSQSFSPPRPVRWRQRKQNTNDGRGELTSISYSSDWSYWHRYDDMGDYN